VSSLHIDIRCKSVISSGINCTAFVFAAKHDDIDNHSLRRAAARSFKGQRIAIAQHSFLIPASDAPKRLHSLFFDVGR